MVTRRKTTRRATGKRAAARPPVTVARAVEAARVIADAEGLEALSMRRLAAALGVEAMSLYHHLPNKEALLDAMVDGVFDEIERPPEALEWRAAMRVRMTSMRAVLLRHRWALRVLESRTSPGSSTLAHHDAVLGCLRRGGLSLPLAAHAYAVLDAFVFGFVHTELTLPFETPGEAQAVVGEMFAAMPAGAFPHLAELTVGHVLRPGWAGAVARRARGAPARGSEPGGDRREPGEGHRQLGLVVALVGELAR
jgi:AcrR family transcriptional regulator